MDGSAQKSIRSVGVQPDSYLRPKYLLAPVASSILLADIILQLQEAVRIRPIAAKAKVVSPVPDQGI
jgi:hypothetical protein